MVGIASRNAAGQRASGVSSPTTITSPVCQATACSTRAVHAGSMMVAALRGTTTTSAASILASAAVHASGDEPGDDLVGVREGPDQLGGPRLAATEHDDLPGAHGGPTTEPDCSPGRPGRAGDRGQVRSPAARPAMCSGLTPQQPPTTVTPWAIQARVTSTSSSTPMTSTKTQSGMAKRPLSG